MTTSIALGIFILFIFYVIYWSMKNDKVRTIREQTGFIRMRDTTVGDKKKTGNQGQRAKQSRPIGSRQQATQGQGDESQRDGPPSGPRRR